MRALIFLATMVLAQAGSVFAAESDYTEFDVIAVAPRSPDVQPYFLSVPPERRQKAPHPQLANSGKDSKSADALSGIQQHKASAKAVNPSVQRLTQAEE